MRILFVTREFVTETNSSDGGLANYLYKIAKILVANGHNVIVLIPAEKNELFNFNGIEVRRHVYPRINLLYKLIDKITLFKKKTS